MKRTKLWVKLLSVIMATVLVAASIPFFAVAQESKIRFGVISDIHMLADSLKCPENENYQNFIMNVKNKNYHEKQSLKMLKIIKT